LKSQDLLGIFLAIGITVISVGVAFVGESLVDEKIQTTSVSQNDPVVSRGSVASQGVGFGGITNTDGESIEFEFIPGNEINLDEHEFVRAKITYTGYLQQMGKVTLNVFSVNTGESVKKSEIFLDLKNDNIWVTDVMHRFDKQNFIDNPDLIGTYLLRVDTEHGTFSGKTPFTVIMPSVKPVVAAAAVSVAPVSVQKASVSTNVEKTVEVTTKANSFTLSDLEPLFKEKVSKAYLTKILKEYYAKNITKEEFVHLKSFEDLDCSVSFTDTPDGEEINISCNLKSVE